jgi:hypothetical protein
MIRGRRCLQPVAELMNALQVLQESRGVDRDELIDAPRC